MRPPFRATQASALISGAVLGVAMPTIEAVGQDVGLSQRAQGLAFIVGLAFLFFAPVLIYVVGTEHLGIKSTEMLKRTYWVSLGQVAFRAVFWLVGGGLGFALLAAVHGLSP